MHSSESRFVIGPSSILCALFSPEILQAEAVKGLILLLFFVLFLFVCVCVCVCGGGGPQDIWLSVRTIILISQLKTEVVITKFLF